MELPAGYLDGDDSIIGRNFRWELAFENRLDARPLRLNRSTLPYMLNRSRRIAQVGITIQFVALIRCLGEFFRLKYFVAEKFSIVHIEPFVIGAGVTAILALVGILFYFAEKYPLTAVVASLNVIILFILRFTLL
jgi:hypothetical protein